MANYRSSFHGHLLEIDGVSVDNFTGVNLMSRAFFLSHCHSDHMQGLFTVELQRVLAESEGVVRVYMSERSADIVRREATQELSSAITVLKLGTVHLKLPETNQLKEEYISVTAIPAGHCLGSVMLLFQTSRDQTILYTGDFRIRENDVCKYAQLHKNGEPIRIDSMYIDTTFLDPQYANFPKRTECIEELVRCITNWLKKDAMNRVALSTSAKYGYEYVFMELSQKLGTKIFVEPAKWEFYKNMKFMEPAVSNEVQYSRVHACVHINDRFDHTRCGLLPQAHNYLFIRLSARRFRNYERTYSSPVFVTSEKRLDVCFPTHCSRSEIKAFVEYYAPKKIVGFPNEYDLNEDKSDCIVLNEPILQNRTPKKSPNKRRSLENSPLTKKVKTVDKKVDRQTLKDFFNS